MGRLIDADANREDFKKIVYRTLNDCGATAKEKFNLIMTAFDNIPIEYDVDKVVAEIREQFGCKDCEYADEFQYPGCNECAEFEVINDICKIVRKGGVNG